jgi:adenine deaminase
MHARRNCLLQRDEWGSQEEAKMAFDLLIKNGRVVDGSGERSYMADVAVQGGRIVGSSTDRLFGGWRLGRWPRIAYSRATPTTS